MKKEYALARGLEIIESQQFFHFSTVGEDGYPRTRIMFNLRSSPHYPHIDRSLFEQSKPFTLYVGTNTSSCKVPQLGKNNRVSAYFVDLDSWEGILLTGTAFIVESMEAKKAVWSDDWKTYYAGGVSDPDFCLFKIKPEKAEVYGGGNVHHFNREEIVGR